MERATDEYTIKTVDDKENTIKLYKYLTPRESQQIMNLLVQNGKYNSKSEDLDIDAKNLFEFRIKLAETYYAKSNEVKFEDLDNGSLMEVIEPKLDTFLGKFNSGLQVGNN